MNESDSVQVLVKQAQQGVTEAFDALMLHYQVRVARLVARYIFDPSDVPDVTQEVFIKVLAALPHFRGDSRFYTWLYRIAINTAKNYLVARARQPLNHAVSLEDAEEFLPVQLGPERLLISAEILAKTFAAINHLPRELREAILMREMDGLSYEDIALCMGCPVGTVRSRIFRARVAVIAEVSVFLQDNQ